MKLFFVPRLLALLTGLASIGSAQANPSPSPIPKNASAMVMQAFDTHDVVMLGEIHWNKQEYDWLESLVADPDFADRVDYIVMEFGNSLYQKSVDRYIAGKAVPIKDVQRAWRNTLGLGPPPPIYAELYKAVREANIRRRGKHQMRVLCGDPYIDWGKVKTREDVGPFLGHREEWYAQVVKDNVLAKHHRAFLIAGSGHFLREGGYGYVEPALRRAGAKTFLILAGTNAVKGYDDLDRRFDAWPAPSIALLAGNWLGDLPAIPVISGGTQGLDSSLKLKDTADALLYLGTRDSLIRVSAARGEVDGTTYGKELLRRMTVLGFYPFLPESTETEQFSAQFTRPKPATDPVAFPEPPKNMNAPLPPRPPSQ